MTAATIIPQPHRGQVAYQEYTLRYAMQQGYTWTGLTRDKEPVTQPLLSARLVHLAWWVEAQFLLSHASDSFPQPQLRARSLIP